MIVNVRVSVVIVNMRMVCCDCGGKGGLLSL